MCDSTTLDVNRKSSRVFGKECEPPSTVIEYVRFRAICSTISVGRFSKLAVSRCCEKSQDDGRVLK
jgi:hypothetical protein